ncbi:MAG: hypothetical protein R3F60_12500 [bacterium]
MRPFALALGVACLATAGVGRAEDADDWAWMGATAYAGSLVGGAYGFLLFDERTSPDQVYWVSMPLGAALGAGVGAWLGVDEPDGRLGWLLLGGTLGTAVATGLFRIGSSMPGKRNGFLKVGLTTLPPSAPSWAMASRLAARAGSAASRSSCRA